MKPEGSKIEAEDAIDLVFVGEGTATPPARGSSSDVNKTKFLRPRSK